MDDREIRTIGAQAKEYALAIFPAEFRRTIVVAAGGAQESVIVRIPVVSGVLGEDVKYLELPGWEIVAKNHTGALAAIGQRAAQTRHAEQGVSAIKDHRAVGLFASRIFEVVKEAEARAVDVHFVYRAMAVLPTTSAHAVEHSAVRRDLRWTVWGRGRSLPAIEPLEDGITRAAGLDPKDRAVAILLRSLAVVVVGI